MFWSSRVSCSFAFGYWRISVWWRKTIAKVITQPITKDIDVTVSQSKLEVLTCSLRKTPENVCERWWWKLARVFFRPVVRHSNAKSITFRQPRSHPGKIPGNEVDFSTRKWKPLYTDVNTAFSIGDSVNYIYTWYANLFTTLTYEQIWCTYRAVNNLVSKVIRQLLWFLVLLTFC